MTTYRVSISMLELLIAMLNAALMENDLQYEIPLAVVVQMHSAFHLDCGGCFQDYLAVDQPRKQLI